MIRHLASPPVRVFWVAALVALGAGAGCCPVQKARIGWNGPTEPMWKVVQGVNANASKITTLRVPHNYDALILDQNDKEHRFSGGGYLLFRKPDDLLLTAKVVTQDAFTVGGNAGRYWFTVPSEDTMWWGMKSNVGGEKASQIPIRPDLLPEVLGVHEIDTNFGQPPVPVMRFNNDEDAYMFTWTVPLRDRWAVVKEVWYDRQTLLPILVNLFDENGRIVIKAKLGDHQEVEGANGGKLATTIRLVFLGVNRQSQMDFRLHDPQARFKNLPNDASFAFPEEPGVGKIIEIK